MSNAIIHGPKDSPFIKKFQELLAEQGETKTASEEELKRVPFESTAITLEDRLKEFEEFLKEHIFNYAFHNDMSVIEDFVKDLQNRFPEKNIDCSTPFEIYDGEAIAFTIFVSDKNGMKKYPYEIDI